MIAAQRLSLSASLGVERGGRDLLAFIGLNALAYAFMLSAFPEALGIGVPGPVAGALVLVFTALGAASMAVVTRLVDTRHAAPLLVASAGLLLAAGGIVAALLPREPQVLLMAEAMAITGLVALTLIAWPGITLRVAPVELAAGALFIGMAISTWALRSLGIVGAAGPGPAIGAAQVALGLGLILLRPGPLRAGVTALSIVSLVVLSWTLATAGSAGGAITTLILVSLLARDAYRLGVTECLALLGLLVGVLEVLGVASLAIGGARLLPAWVPPHLGAALAAIPAALLLTGRLKGASPLLVLAGVAALAADALLEVPVHGASSLVGALILAGGIVAIGLGRGASPIALAGSAIAGATAVIFAVMDVFAHSVGTEDVHLVFGVGAAHAAASLGWIFLGAAMVVRATALAGQLTIRMRSFGLTVFVSYALLVVIIANSSMASHAAGITEQVAGRLAAARSGQVATALLTAYVAVLVTLAIWVIVRVTGDLDRLVAAMLAHTGGDLSARAEIQGGDEVATAGRAFDTLADHLAIAERSRLEADRRFRERALYDEATGLASRGLMRDALARLTAQSMRTETPFTLVTVELKGLPDLMSSFGAEVADEVVAVAARRIQSLSRAGDTAARVEQAGFALLAPGAGLAAGKALGARARAELETTISALGHDFHLPVAVGVATFPDASDGPGIWSAATAALIAARDGAGGGLVTFEPEMASHARARFSLLADLSAAVSGGQLRVLFQPQLGLRSGRIEAVEALVRWEHPTRGMLEPSEFMHLAERNGVVRQVDHAVLAMALERCAAWVAAGLRISVAVNMSGRTMSDAETAGRIASALSAAKVPPSLLTIEITEEALITDLDAVQQTVARVRRAGARVSIDDFGAGHASFAYLRDLAVDDVKIDRSFVNGMIRRPDDATIVRSIVTLSHELGRRVVAEGVEDEETLQALRLLGCDQVQGYLIGRPAPAEAIEQLLRAAPAEAPARRLQVLVVEDYEPTARLMARIMTEEGYGVAVAGSVEQARSELFRGSFALALLDVGLPDGTGAELAAWIRVRWPRMKILIVTGTDPSQLSPDLARYLRVPKPFVPADLRAAVHAVIA